jgi:hypothetical protein
MKLYLLHHTYDTEYDQETKFLGVYSSEKKIKEAIEIYYKLPGFNKYSKECFIVGICNIDENSNWLHGFTVLKEA